jgi:hypothetical protein
MRNEAEYTAIIRREGKQWEEEWNYQEKPLKAGRKI